MNPYRQFHCPRCHLFDHRKVWLDYDWDMKMYKCPTCHRQWSEEFVSDHNGAILFYVWYCSGCGNVFYDPQDKDCSCTTTIWIPIELELSHMTPTTNVRIWWDTSVNAYRMASPFNRELVDGIKTFIPVSDRSYDPATKIWTFVERQLTPL